MHILIRYGEIALKSPPVRRRMEDMLVNNIKNALHKNHLQCTVRKSFGRIFLETSQLKQTEQILKKIFGLVSLSPCYSCPSTLDEIQSLALKIAKKATFKTFAVKTRRVGKHTFSSQEVNELIGDAIRKKLKKKVNLTNPEKTFFIEIRDNTSYLYTEKIPGLGGFPLGTQGKVIALIQNKNDLLAAWLFMRRGCNLIPVTNKKAFVKTLEDWAFKKIPFYKTEDLRDMIKKENVFGIVTSDFDHLKTLKKHSLPVYNPLLGMEDKEIKRMIKFIT